MPATDFLEEFRNLSPTVPLGRASDQGEFTGERFLPGYADGSIDLQHVHRYCFALQFVVGKTVLDIACGEGYGCEILGQVASDVIGVDIDPKIIKTAQDRYTRSNLSFKTGDASTIPLEDESVDIIVSFETLEHLSDQNAFWCEIKRVLRKTGTLIISSPNREAYNEQRTQRNPFHIRELSSEELVRELSSRFSNHQLFSQANLFGSYIVPVSAESGPHCQISLQPDTRRLQWRFVNELANPFSVAIASDTLLPLAGQSLYSGAYPPDAMASLAGGIVERDLLIRDLRAELAEFDNKHTSLILAAQQDKEDALAVTKRTEELLTAARQERDEAITSGKSTEEYLSAEKQSVNQQRDQAIRMADLFTQTLAEQDGIIGALRGLVDEYSQHSNDLRPAKNAGPSSSSERVT